MNLNLTQENLGSKEHLDYAYQKEIKLREKIQDKEKNLKKLLMLKENNDIFLYKKLLFNKREINNDYIYNFQRIGFNEYGYPINEDEKTTFNNIYNKEIKKTFYMHEVFNEDLLIYFKKKLKEIFKKEDYEKIKEKFFRIEFMTAKYAGWHNDILFNTERDTYYGNLLWCISCPKNKYFVETEKDKIYLEKDKIYFLNDYENHRMIYDGNIKEKTKPVYLICIKISDIEINEEGIKSNKIL